jgi:hypothetical protein
LGVPVTQESSKLRITAYVFGEISMRVITIIIADGWIGACIQKNAHGRYIVSPVQSGSAMIIYQINGGALFKMGHRCRVAGPLAQEHFFAKAINP